LHELWPKGDGSERLQQVFAARVSIGQIGVDASSVPTGPLSSVRVSLASVNTLRMEPVGVERARPRCRTGAIVRDRGTDEAIRVAERLAADLELTGGEDD